MASSLIASIAGAPSAAAYPLPNEQTNGCAFTRNTPLYFAPGGLGWTTAQKNQILFGAGYWNGIVNPGGGIPTSSYVSATASGARVVVHADVGQANQGGVAVGDLRGGRGPVAGFSCAIGIDDQVATADMYLVATHEMGHERGLPHTGEHDSQDGQVPAMSTCLGPMLGGSMAGRTPGLAQDDVASLTRRLGNWPLNANSGFEMGGLFLGLSQVTPIAEPTGGATGPGRIKMEAQSGSSGPWFMDLYTTVTGAGGKQITPAVTVADFNNSGSTTFRVELWARSHTYAGSNTICGFWNNANMNSPEIGAWGKVASFADIPTTDAWKDWNNVTAWPVQAGWNEGVDLIARIYKGGAMPIYVDDLRLLTP